MGWNTLKLATATPCSAGIAGQCSLHLFRHSYHLVPTLPEDLVATTDYGGGVTAMVGYRSLIGTQFT